MVVEDGSQDATEAIVREFARTVTQKVRYQRQAKNAGLPSTRNIANVLALGEWIAFLDADDLWFPEHLARCVDTIHREPKIGEAKMEPGLVFSGCSIFDSETGAVIEYRTPSPEEWADFPNSLHRGDIIIQPSCVVISRKALDIVGGFDSLFPICNDMEYWFRAYRKGVKFAFTGLETTRYRKHEAAMSNRSAALIAEIGWVHFAHRNWQQIPLRQRQREIRKHFLNAAKINRRAKPLQALTQVVSGIVLPILMTS